MFTVHRVKILEKYADDIVYSNKNFEIRKDDRHYKVGDVMEFTVINDKGDVVPNHRLHGKRYIIRYKHEGDGTYGIEAGFCILGIEEHKDVIFTHDEAASIVDLFDDILCRYEIKVPSPEDDEREPDNETGLYGSTYSDLLDEVEEILIELLERHTPLSTVEKYVFPGTVVGHTVGWVQ